MPGTDALQLWFDPFELDESDARLMQRPARRASAEASIAASSRARAPSASSRYGKWDRPAADELEEFKHACGCMCEGSDTALVMRARDWWASLDSRPERFGTPRVHRSPRDRPEVRSPALNWSAC